MLAKKNANDSAERQLIACLPADHYTSLYRPSASCLRGRSKTQHQQLRPLRSSATGGIPPAPPFNGTAVTSDDRGPEKTPSWLVRAALIITGGAVSSHTPAV